MECLNPFRLGRFLGRLPDGSAIVSNHTPDWTNYLGSDDITTKEWVYAPCGKCPLCIKRKKRDMALRLSHEISVTPESCFVTLTYSDKFLPPDSELSKRDLQLFFKKLRHHTKSFRYFAVGEYGSLHHRPHYHIIILGWVPPDLIDFEWRGSYMIYRSQVLEDVWPYGFVTVGSVNLGVARYCAQYVQKKSQPTKGKKVPEFFVQSLRQGGIGSPYLAKYWRDVSNLGYCLDRNSHGIFKQPIPIYYLQWLRKHHPAEWLSLILRREQFHLVDKPLSELRSKASAFELKQKNKLKERRLDNE